MSCHVELSLAVLWCDIFMCSVLYVSCMLALKRVLPPASTQLQKELQNAVKEVDEHACFPSVLCCFY
jgi:hypothetical protein